MQFTDSIIIDNEPKMVIITIKENDGGFYNRFDVNIQLHIYSFILLDQTLGECVKWVNKKFCEKTCIKCKNFHKLSKDGYCLNCLEQDCLKIKTDKICPICLDDLYRNIFRTKCGHYFHTQCIINLQKCPVCRFNFYEEFNIPNTPDFSDDDSN